MVRIWLAVLLLGWAMLAPTQSRAEGDLTLQILRDGAAHQPVVGEMIRVTIRAKYNRKVANEKLEIAPSDGFDWVQTHPDDWREEQIDGLPWIVMERKLALWPKRAGLLHFGPAKHRLTVIDKQSQRKDVVVDAKPLSLSVGEFPALKGWHLAAEAVELTETLSTDAARLADGDTVTRQIRLRVKGALPEHLPPRPVVSENWLITFTAPIKRELYLTETGPVAEVIWGWQFRPLTGEPGLLEPVRLPYFNTRSHQLEYVEIPALTIGYASFFTGQVPVGQFDWKTRALALGAAGLGFVLAALALLWQQKPDLSQMAWARFRARYSPILHYQIYRARRAGDLLALRRLAGIAQWPAAEIAALETRIYQKPPSDQT